MNTEHTNQSSQAEPAPRNTTELQSVPKRQRDFTAENIRDIAHECMRIGDNEQAAAVFAIADALRDGNLIIQPPARQQAEPVAYLKTAASVMQLSFDGRPFVNAGADVEVQADTVQPLYAQPPAVAVAVPDGYALAPLEMSPAMHSAGVQALVRSLGKNDPIKVLNVYRAVLAATPQAEPLSAALADIAAERRRQMEVEGWTPEHDDQYQQGAMAMAAACYALEAYRPPSYKRFNPRAWWPWDSRWWKPTTARRDLVKAGALIAAEIERLDRAAQKGGA